MNLLIVLAVLGVLTVAFGVGLIYLPAGVITGGLELVAGAYVAAYLKAKQ